MARFIQAALVLGLVASVAACARAPEPQEIVFIDPAPITTDKVSTKYR